jgi:crotonobetainyl-CoA:carnitine CoA-transferase CaiB-like acyl-CoA transferase
MKILEGIQVIDVTVYAFGLAAGGVLAHWGADVIKIENPKGASDPRSPTSPGPGGSGFLF